MCYCSHSIALVTKLVTAADNLIDDFCFDSYGCYFWLNFGVVGSFDSYFDGPNHKRHVWCNKKKSLINKNQVEGGEETSNTIIN